MKKKQQRIQFVLVSIGFLLIIATYFYFPGIKKDKILKDQTANKEDQKVEGDGESTYFENYVFNPQISFIKTF